jgi:outer membrane protein TolC
MKVDCEASRETLENAQAALAHAEKRLQLVTLRVDTARQHGLSDLLAPAVSDLVAARQKIRTAQKALGELWNKEIWKG